ncbi:MAG: hypothetical protein AB1797_02055 [bacterium]
MAISLIKEEQEHIIRVLPILLKKDEQFKTSLYSILSETFVKKDDFSELKDIVREIGIKVSELAEAQKRTELRVKELAEAQKRTEVRVEELAEAQKRTELRVKELAEAQKRTEVRIEELAEAQKRTEVRVEELAEAQKRTEVRVEELAQAQKRTEEELKALSKEVKALTEDVKALTKSHEDLTISHKDLAKKVGGLDHTVGFRLEDESFKALPGLLKRDMGLEIIGRLKRDYIEIKKGRYIEVNIFGKGKLNGKEYIIIGEAKSQLKRRDVDDFIKHGEMVKKYVTQEQIRLLVTYQAHPSVQDYVKKEGISLYFSYEF